MISLDKNSILSRLDFRACYEAETGRTLRAGENLICSPLRDDRNKSLSINTHTGLWHDFGTGQGGDVIAFVQLKHSLDFKAALEYLSRYAGGNPGHQAAPCRRTPEPAKARAIRQGVRADYTYREVVIGLTNRGRFEGANTPDYFDAPGSRECYHSVYLHHADILEHSKQHTRKLAGYSGPVWCDTLYFDVDFKDGTLLENIGNAQHETRRLVQSLKNNGVSNCKIKFSGSKGFHISFSHSTLDTLSGYTETPIYVERFARKIAEGITIDTSIYGNAIKLIRSVNSINSKSGLYAIPLSEGELFTLKPEEIISLAKNPRPTPKDFKPVCFHSHLLGESGTIRADNVIFDNGATFTMSEIDLLKKENNKQTIKALFLLKKHFDGEIKKDGSNGKTRIVGKQDNE